MVCVLVLRFIYFLISSFFSIRARSTVSIILFDEWNEKYFRFLLSRKLIDQTFLVYRKKIYHYSLINIVQIIELFELSCSIFFLQQFSKRLKVFYSSQWRKKMSKQCFLKEISVDTKSVWLFWGKIWRNIIIWCCKSNRHGYEKSILRIYLLKRKKIQNKKKEFFF